MQFEDGWTLSNVSKYASDTFKGAAYLGVNGARISSPVFPKPIVQVRVESATTSAGEIKRDLSLVPYVSGKEGNPIVLERPSGKVFAEERIDLSSCGAKSFYLVLSGTSGNWAIRKITVIYGEYVPEVTPVSGVSVSGRGPDAFSLAWEPVLDAVGYVVDVWTNGDAFVHENAVVTNCSFDCPANPVLHGFSVKARFDIRGETVDSPAVTGRVDMASPPWLRCWKLSGFLPKPGCRVADFSELGQVRSRRVWSNGIDGDCFYAYKNADPETQIRPATWKSVYGDLYCYNAGTEDAPTNSLALLGSDSVAMRLVLPIRLDPEQKVTELGISFSAREVKAGTAAETVLSFAWATVEDIQTMDRGDVVWTDVPSASFVSTEGFATRDVAFPVSPLRNASYLCLKWSVLNRPNSSMLGISDVRVFGKLRKGGMAVFIR